MQTLWEARGPCTELHNSLHATIGSGATQLWCSSTPWGKGAPGNLIVTRTVEAHLSQELCLPKLAWAWWSQQGDLFFAGMPWRGPGPGARSTPDRASPPWGGPGERSPRTKRRIPSPLSRARSNTSSPHPSCKKRALGAWPTLARVDRAFLLESFDRAPPPRPASVRRTDRGLRMAKGVAPPGVTVAAHPLPRSGLPTSLSGPQHPPKPPHLSGAVDSLSERTPRRA